MAEPDYAWYPVAHTKTAETCEIQPRRIRQKKALKRRAKKRRICSCALRGQCRFICGSMQCPQRRRFRRKKH